MPNRNYQKGKLKEHKIVRQLKEQGWTIAQRSAGSHSPIDIFAINRDTKEILFIQSKCGEYAEREIVRLNKEYEWLNGGWNVRFEAR